MTEKTEQLILGVEGGGTKTDWVLVRGSGDGAKVIDSGQLPAANLLLISDEHLTNLLRRLPTGMDRAGVFLAGCKTEEHRARIRRIAESVWGPSVRLAVGGDRDSGFAAAFGDKDGITAISGTGSAVTGRKNGRIEKAGGGGHILGDGGGGYTLAIRALRQVLRSYDLAHTVTVSGQELLRALMLNRMEDLIEWTQHADKTAVASLAPVVFTAAELGSVEMMAVLKEGAAMLATSTTSVAKWLEFEKPDVRLQGGNFLHQPLYVDLFREALAERIETSSVETCNTLGALGAVHLAASGSTIDVDRLYIPADEIGIEELARASTEQVNPRSTEIASMTTAEMVELFVKEEDAVATALAAQSVQIADAVDLIARSFRSDGRLFYIGAGTSGRLGTLDASEIPPTFGEPPHRVQAIMAGGVNALSSSVEGAEDNADEAKLAIIERGVTAGDVVCGIAASGRTPFVLAGLEEAREIGAKTILLTCNPNRSRNQNFDVEIDLPTGPELITGSTRLKAGTATKVTLNILSTCSLILAGRTTGNLMTGLRATNAKLRNRAISMVSRLKGISADAAVERLTKAKWNVTAALED